MRASLATMSGLLASDMHTCVHTHRDRQAAMHTTPHKITCIRPQAIYTQRNYKDPSDPTGTKAKFTLYLPSTAFIGG